jgi:NADPH:quinone reductase-like Zn-dependent oxidoreductase
MSCGARGLDEELYAKGGDVVLIDGPDLAAQVAHATGGEPVALALDPVGGDTYTRLTSSLGVRRDDRGVWHAVRKSGDT